MDQPNPNDHQPPARIVAGALAHLARHMETGCPRSAWLAAMLLEQVAADPEADGHLRAHARELVDILEKDREREAQAPVPRQEQPQPMVLDNHRVLVSES